MLFPTGKTSGIILEESLTDNGICISTSNSVNESLQQSLGEMKEVLQSKTVVESNYSTDVGKFSVHVCTCREINAEKCDDKVTENEEVDMTTASSEIEKREAQLGTMEKHNKGTLYTIINYNGCDASALIQMALSYLFSSEGI